VFLHTFNLIYTELLKEVEVGHLQPAVTELSRVVFTDAAARAKEPGPRRATWIKLRDLFAVPWALLSTTTEPLTMKDFYKNGNLQDPSVVEEAHRTADANTDTGANVSAFVRTLGLGPRSEKAVLQDVARIFAARDTGVPSVLAADYAAVAAQTGHEFRVDFTQFTPRIHYTTNSQRRQYFRALDGDLFDGEHGVTALMPFLARLLPGTTVLPLVLSVRRPFDEDLVDVVDDLLDPGTALVVSSDFSHGRTPTEADALDEATARALFTGQGVGGLDNPTQSDCPSCLRILSTLAARHGFDNPSVVGHTHAARLVGREEKGTSHLGILWYRDDPPDPRVVAVAGDVTFSRDLSLPPALAAMWDGAGPRVLNQQSRTPPGRPGPGPGRSRTRPGRRGGAR